MTDALLYIYSRGWRKRVEAVAARRAPAEAYGYFALRAAGVDVQGVDEELRASLPWEIVGHPVERLWFARRTGLGYRLRQARAVAALVEGDPGRALVATSDSIGLPLLALHERGRLPNKLIHFSIGLCDRIERGMLPGGFVRRYLRLLAQAWTILVFTPVEERLLRTWLRDSDVRQMPYGVDVDWWTPSPRIPVLANSVFSAGRDSGRAFTVLADAVQGLGVTTTVVGSLAIRQGLVPSPSLHLPGELEIDAFRKALWSAEIVVVPSRSRLYGSGQITALQAMAAGKPVIMTDTGWAEAQGLVPGRHFIDVPPDDVTTLRRAIESLLESSSTRLAVGTAARDAVGSLFTPHRQGERILEAVG